MYADEDILHIKQNKFTDFVNIDFEYYLDIFSYISSYRCRQIDWGHGCMLNASFPVRFYEIEDIATDMIGNVGTARKKVIVADGNMLFVGKKDRRGCCCLGYS